MRSPDGVSINPEHVFPLEYPVDNGQRAGWPWASEACYLVRWSDGGLTVRRLSDHRNLDYEEESDAAAEERVLRGAAAELTNLRRTADGVKPYQYAG